MKFRLLLAGLLTSQGAAAQMSVADSDIALHAPDSHWQSYAKVQAWAAYDAIPLRDFTGNWDAHYTPRNGRNAFLQRNRAEFGVEKDGWRVGAEYRIEVSLHSNRDTVEAYHLYLQRLTPAGPRRYVADAHLQAWSGSGMRVGRTMALPANAAGTPLLMVSGALYGSLRNRDADVSGAVDYTPGNAYRFDAQYFSTNNKYQYPFMPEVAQRSSGATLSAALQWPITSQLTANVAINDLWSRLRWTNLPALEKVIHSDVRTVDADGYINYRPQVQGQNSLLDRSSRIGASTALNLRYVLERWSLQAGVEHIDGTGIPRLAAGYRSDWGSFSASYDTRFNMLGLGYDIGPLRARVSSSRLPLSETSAFSAELGLHYRW